MLKIGVHVRFGDGERPENAVALTSSLGPQDGHFGGDYRNKAQARQLVKKNWKNIFQVPLVTTAGLKSRDRQPFFDAAETISKIASKKRKFKKAPRTMKPQRGSLLACSGCVDSRLGPGGPQG